MHLRRHHHRLSRDRHGGGAVLAQDATPKSLTVPGTRVPGTVVTGHSIGPFTKPMPVRPKDVGAWMTAVGMYMLGLNIPALVAAGGSLIAAGLARLRRDGGSTFDRIDHDLVPFDEHQGRGNYRIIQDDGGSRGNFLARSAEEAHVIDPSLGDYIPLERMDLDGLSSRPRRRAARSDDADPLLENAEHFDNDDDLPDAAFAGADLAARALANTMSTVTGVAPDFLTDVLGSLSKSALSVLATATAAAQGTSDVLDWIGSIGLGGDLTVGSVAAAMSTAATVLAFLMLPVEGIFGVFRVIHNIRLKAAYKQFLAAYKTWSLAFDDWAAAGFNALSGYAAGRPVTGYTAGELISILQYSVTRALYGNGSTLLPGAVPILTGLMNGLYGFIQAGPQTGTQQALLNAIQSAFANPQGVNIVDFKTYCLAFTDYLFNFAATDPAAFAVDLSNMYEHDPTFRQMIASDPTFVSSDPYAPDPRWGDFNLPPWTLPENTVITDYQGNKIGTIPSFVPYKPQWMYNGLSTTEFYFDAWGQLHSGPPPDASGMYYPKFGSMSAGFDAISSFQPFGKEEIPMGGTFANWNMKKFHNDPRLRKTSLTNPLKRPRDVTGAKMPNPKTFSNKRGFGRRPLYGARHDITSQKIPKTTIPSNFSL